MFGLKTLGKVANGAARVTVVVGTGGLAAPFMGVEQVVKAQNRGRRSAKTQEQILKELKKQGRQRR